MKILAIGAHPDDIEIFMFGLLLLLKKRGDKIFLAVATDGSLGGVDYKNSLVKKRKKETIEGLKELEKPYFFNFPDGKLGYESSHKLLLHDYIYNIKPDLIITHDKNDYHADHRALSSIIESISGHNIPVIYCDTMMGLNFDPMYYVDITSVFKLKKKAVLCHKSQNPERFINLIETMNGYRSAQCNSPIGTFAESYSFKKSFPFTDLRSLLPTSPKLRKFDIKKNNGFL